MKHVRFNRHLYRRAAEKVFNDYDDFPPWVPPLNPHEDSNRRNEVDKE